MADGGQWVLPVRGGVEVAGTLAWLVRQAKYLWHRKRMVECFGWPCGSEMVLMGHNGRPLVRVAVRRWRARPGGVEGDYEVQSEYITKANMHEHCSTPLTDAALEALARIGEQVRPVFDEPVEMAYAVKVRLEPYDDEIVALLAASREGDTVAAAALRDRGLEMGRLIEHLADVTYFLQANAGLDIRSDDVELHAPNPAEEGPLKPPQEGEGDDVWPPPPPPPPPIPEPEYPPLPPCAPDDEVPF